MCILLIRMFSLLWNEKEIDLYITKSEVPSSVVEGYHKLKSGQGIEGKRKDIEEKKSGLRVKND